MIDFSLSTLLMRLVALLVVTALAGFFLALATRLLGDRGPSYDGRLSINLFEHIDFLAVVPFVFFQTGWIRPMAIDPKALRPHPGLGAAIAVLCTLMATLAVVAVLWNLRGIVSGLSSEPRVMSLIESNGQVLVDLAIWFVLLNLLPISPLLGGVALGAWAPRAASFFERYSLPTRIALIAALATGWPQGIARPAFILVRSAVGG